MKHILAMKKSVLPILSVLLFHTVSSAQLSVRPDAFWPSSVTNTGLVSGYFIGGSEYLVWDPDASTTEGIGGAVAGDGVGGQPVFSADGARVGGTSAGPEGPEIATYDVATGTWTPHGGLGVMLDGTVGAGFGMSADGSTVVGLSWADTSGGNAFQAHAVAHRTDEGLIDLGSLFADRSTRANAASADGSVVVGWQDFNGPWKSAVWRKDPEGGYFPNTYLLIDPEGDPDDEFNQLGECGAVSADGTWIGGHGDYANADNPWVWSEATGVINLGVLPESGMAFVSGMSGDGSTVVGWFNGEFFGAPRKPFIWTAVDGLRDLNVYIAEELGLGTGDQVINTVVAISANGRYLVGNGTDNTDFSPFAYRLDIGGGVGIDERSTLGFTVYPNPVTDVVRFVSPVATDMVIHHSDGTLVRSGKVSGNVDLDLSELAKGVYAISLRSEGVVRTQRIVKH